MDETLEISGACTLDDHEPCRGQAKLPTKKELETCLLNMHIS